MSKWLAALAALWLSVTGCTAKPKEVSMVSPQEAMGLLRNDFAVLVDVREADEVRQTGLAAPAHWFPMSKIRAGDEEWRKFLAEQPTGKQILFYCAAGGRAGQVAADVAKQGHRTGNVGGFRDWAAAGLPTKPGP